MKSESDQEPTMPSPIVSSLPSDAVPIAERGRELAELLLYGLKEGVRAEQEQLQSQEQATRRRNTPSVPRGHKKKLPLES